MLFYIIEAVAVYSVLNKYPNDAEAAVRCYFSKRSQVDTVILVESGQGIWVSYRVSILRPPSNGL